MLRQYLPCVLQYSRDEATVYVADNASTDDSLQLLRSEFPEVRLILLDKNWGFADGYNKALKQVDAGTYHVRLIHGYNRGKSLMHMIRDEYRYDKRVKRIMPGDNPGITVLVIREL